MPKAYSEDLRRRVVADTDKGLSIRAVADKYSVSPSFVSKITCLVETGRERFPAQDWGLPASCVESPCCRGQGQASGG